MSNSSKFITALLIISGIALVVFGIGYINYFSVLLDSSKIDSVTHIGNTTIKGLANDPIIFGGLWISIGVFFMIVASIMLVHSTDKLTQNIKSIFEGLAFGTLFTLIPGFMIFAIKRVGKHQKLNSDVKLMPYLLSIFVIVGLYMLIVSIFNMIRIKKVEFEWPGTGVDEDKFEEYKEKYRFQYYDALERSEYGLKLFLGIRTIIYGMIAIAIGIIGFSALPDYEQFPYYVKYILEGCTIVIGIIFIILGVKKIKN